MPITLTDRARQGRDARSIRPVWMFDIDADRLGGDPTTLRWATRSITIGNFTYSGDVLAQDNPVAIRYGNLRIRGGHAVPPSATIRCVNAERLQAVLAGLYDLENDPCRIYLYFDGIAGAGLADRILLFSGVIDDYDATQEFLTLSLVSDTFRLLRSFPIDRVTPATHPFAPLRSYGQPLPLVVGRLFSAGPYDGTGERFAIARCLCVDKFTARFLASSDITQQGAVYQLYSSGPSRLVSQIPSSAIREKGDGSFEVTAQTRHLRRPPMRAAQDNEVANWVRVADWRDDTFVTMGQNDLLSLFMGGSTRLGTLTGLRLWLDLTGVVTASTQGATQNLVSTSLQTPQGGGLRSADLSITGWEDAWGFEQINVRIQAVGAVQIRRVWLEATFNHDGIDDIEQWTIGRAVAGLANTSVLANGQTLTNPADIIEGLLLRQEVPTDRINRASFGEAEQARQGWQFGVLIDRPRQPNWFSEVSVQAGYDLYADNEGRFALSAQSNRQDPVGVFLQDEHFLFDEETLRHDLSISTTPMAQLLNEGVVQYGFDTMQNRYAGIAVQSGHYRTGNPNAQGAVATQGDGYRFTDATVASFVALGIQVGDYLWTAGGSGSVLSVVGVTPSALSVRPAQGTAAVVETGISAWYCGPNLSAAVLRSQLRYKLTRDYAAARGDFTATDGYEATLIQDDFTAEALADHLVRWHADRRYQVEISTDWSGCHLQLGDHVVLDTNWLPDAKRPQPIDAAAQATFADATVTISSQAVRAGTLYGDGTAGDLILVGREVCRVTSVGAHVTARRAVLGRKIYPTGQRSVALSRVHVLWRIMAAEVAAPGRVLTWRWRFHEIPVGRPRRFRLWDKATAPPSLADATDDERAIYGIIGSPDGLSDNFDFESHLPILA